MTTPDQLVVLFISAAVLLTAAHLLREKPRAPLLAAAVLCVCMASLLRRILFP
jgi:DMSO reductase anchor subunit